MLSKLKLINVNLKIVAYVAERVVDGLISYRVMCGKLIGEAPFITFAKICLKWIHIY